MTKQEILDRFNDINFVYNDSSRHDTLSRMLDELLKEQETIVRCKDCKYWDIGHMLEAITEFGVHQVAYCERLKAWDSWGALGDDFSMTPDDFFCADGKRR